jgi:thioredoxin 1
MSSNVIEMNDDDFDAQVTSARGRVLVDFWADGCAPCAALAPVLDDVARRGEGNLRIAKVNLSNAPSLAGRFEIITLPTLILFVDGVPARRMIGTQTADALLRQLHGSLPSTDHGSL